MVPLPVPTTAVDAAAFKSIFDRFLGAAAPANACLVIAVTLRDVHANEAGALLTSAERQQAQAFRHNEDRLRFSLGRSSLRCLLAYAATAQPKELVFHCSEFGKLSLPGAPSFNLSHSGELVLIGLHKGADIGVDVEAVKSMPDWASLADHYMTEAERALIRAVPPERQEVDFLRAWTRKEAVIKAVGQGLSMPLLSFSVLPSATGWSVVTATTPLRQLSWSCCELTLDAQHVGALALAAASTTTSCMAVSVPFAALLRLVAP